MSLRIKTKNERSQEKHKKATYSTHQMVKESLKKREKNLKRLGPNTSRTKDQI